MNRRRDVVLYASAIALTSTLSLLSKSAWAAAQAPCAAATIEPAASTIPANFPGFGYTATKATTADIHLKAVASSADVPLTLGPVADGFIKVAPTSPLTVGQSYELSFTPFCSYGPYPQQSPLTFTVAAEAPIPTKLGTAAGAPTFTVKDLGTTQFKIAASYVLENEMKPWAAVYRLGILFDGRPIETKITRSADGTKVDVAATGWCDDSSAGKTKHDVVLRARLPFAPSLETAPASLEFSCPAPKHVTPTGVSIGTPTATPNPAPSSGAGTNNNANGDSASGGCAVGAVASPAPLGSIAALVIVGWSRRRKTSRTSKGGN
jgi:hypothetical protein